MLEPTTTAAAWSVVSKIFISIAAKLGEKYADKAIASLTDKPKTLSEDEYYKAAKTYTDELTHLYGHIRVIGMEKPLPLEGVYTDVNILTKLTSSYRLSEKLAEDIFLGKAGYGEIADKDRGKDGLDVLRNHDKLFLLGKPGAGKTTFLKHTLHRAIEGKLFPKREVIPVFIPLKVWSESGKSFLEFIVQQFDICHFPDAQPFIESILIEGHAIILCDGLDEVMKETRSRCIVELNDFSNKHHKCPFVISCRIAATDYTFEKFTYVEMADFNTEQIKTFVKHWFSVQGEPVKCEDFFKEFDNEKSKGLQELAKTPLLLAMLCLVFQDNLSFPTRQKQIYADAIDALLRKWYGTRGIKHEEIYRNLDHDRKKQMFARIAAESFEKGKYILPRETLEADLVAYLRMIPPGDREGSIDGEAVLRAIECQHGILVERAKDFYTFSHLSIQEYFTAEYVVQNEARGSLRELVENHIYDRRWREVFMRSAETLANADRFISDVSCKLNRTIQDNQRMQQLIHWVETFPIKTSNTLQPYKLRCIFLSLILETAIWIDPQNDTHITDSLDFSLDNLYNLLFDYAKNEYEQNLIESAVSEDYSLSPDLNIDRNLARCVDYFTRSVPPLRFVKKMIKDTINISKLYDMKDLNKELVDLRLPSWKDDVFQKLEFGKYLKGIFWRHREVTQYMFTIEEAMIVADYVYGLRLLLDCLEVAYVTDREGIEERLLRAPE